MPTKKTGPRDVDHYIAGFAAEVQRQLRKVRSVIGRTAPAAQKIISRLFDGTSLKIGGMSA
jgi:hypothetical protein